MRAALLFFLAGCAHLDAHEPSKCTPDPTYNGTRAATCLDVFELINGQDVRMCGWGDGSDSDSFYAYRVGCRGEWQEAPGAWIERGPSL